jgi:hypothetical protein
MTRFSMTFCFFSHAGYIPVDIYAPFMVVFTTCGGLRPLYGGVYIVEEHGEEAFLLNMDDIVIYILVLHHKHLSCFCDE